jgi:hypothetical protein
MSRIFADSLEGVRSPTIPDFQSAKWRYEFCIFIMFWLWYVANLPKFASGGATEHLLNAYHRDCSRAFLRAKLIEKTREALLRLQSPNVTGRGTVGWVLAHQLFPGEQPDSRVVTLLNEFASVHFTGLVEMFTNLKKQ